jgi:orotidine-5'-phosphate decarboxylase
MNPILVALDVESAAKAIDLADQLRGTVGGYKIGKQLFTAAGPAMVRQLTDRGDRVFLDLKFHDIPNTVAGAVQSAVATGAWMVNVHASGGTAMMVAAAEAARTSAEALGRPRPLVIGVTVLTSMTDAMLAEVGVASTVIDHVVHLARLAEAAGLDGVVASPRETRAIRDACRPDFQIVTPGIRPLRPFDPSTSSGSSRAQSRDDTLKGAADQQGKDDQARTLTPAEAMAAGATYLVIGRPITGAPNPREAAERIAATLP